MFTRDLLEDRRQVYLFGLSLLLAFLVTVLGFLQRIFDTTALTLGQWLVCIGVAATLIVVDEVIKFFLRRNRRMAEQRSSAAAPAITDGHTDSRGMDYTEQSTAAPAS